MFLPTSPLGTATPITYERVLESRKQTPRRVDFIRTRPGLPKRVSGPNYVGSFSLPFEKTVGPIFTAGTGLDLFPSKQAFEGHGPGVWRSIQTDDEFSQIQEWVSSQGSRVFLRDCLDLSLALDYNFVDVDGNRTVLGELEHNAKIGRDAKAIDVLSGLLSDAIQNLPFYASAPKLMAVPAAREKAYDLPSSLASRVSSTLSKEDLTPHFSFHADKGQVKDSPLNEKWLQLESADLQYSGSDLGGACVILIDDKYQSGTTMQFVAMKLQQAGAKRVFGISLVKTLRDGDNLASQ
jgi:predicted amidophosphoribosyltransferase